MRQIGGFLENASRSFCKEFSRARETFAGSASSIGVQPGSRRLGVVGEIQQKTPRWQPRGGDTHLSGR